MQQHVPNSPSRWMGRVCGRRFAPMGGTAGLVVVWAVLALAPAPLGWAAGLDLPSLVAGEGPRAQQRVLAQSDPQAGATPVVDCQIQLVAGRGVANDDGSWTVPVGERVEWSVTWSIYNASNHPLYGVGWVDAFAGEIDVVAGTVEASGGEVTVLGPVPGRQRFEVYWWIGTVPAQTRVQLTFHVATGRRTGLAGVEEQMYGRAGDYTLDTGLLAGWLGGWRAFAPVAIHAQELAWMRVQVSSSRLDWRIGRPGRYAARAFQFQVASNQSVRVTFADFADLTGPGESSGGGLGLGGAVIPVRYGAGDSLAQADGAGWWSADQLNEQAIAFDRSPVLRDVGVAYSLWQQILVTADHPSGEYEDFGRVIFTLVNLDQPVIGG